MVTETEGERMNTRVRMRFWIEVGLGVMSALLLLLTLVTREWIELLFGVDPDGGSGALEWLIDACLVLLALVFGALARPRLVRTTAARVLRRVRSVASLRLPVLDSESASAAMPLTTL